MKPVLGKIPPQVVAVAAEDTVVVGVAVGITTRASFVLVVYSAAYLAMGIAESIFEKARTLDRARLPPAVRAELDADEALEPDPEDEDESDKPEEDEYI